MPTTIIINKNFKEKYRVKGYVDWKEEKYISLIKKTFIIFFPIQVEFQKDRQPIHNLKI